jgi:hypothetical protein
MSEGQGEEAGMADKAEFTRKLAEMAAKGEMSEGAAFMANLIVSPALFAKRRAANQMNGEAGPSEPAPGE